MIITNEKDFTFGEYVYCGQRTGQTVLITGRLAVIYFYSDNAVEERGFLLLFSITPHGMYNITEYQDQIPVKPAGMLVSESVYGPVP